MDAKVLYICGNGFDLFHGYKSGYYNYKEYLKGQLPRIVKDYESFSFIGKSTIDKWTDVESSLTLEYEEIRHILENEEGNFEYELEELTEFIYDFTGKFLVEWLLEVCKFCPKKKIVFEQNSIFLNFNYTNTLENIYKINENQIYHIHGYIENVEGSCFASQDIILPSHISTQGSQEAIDAADIIPRFKQNNDIVKGEIQFGSVYNNYKEFDYYYQEQKRDYINARSDIKGLSVCADFCSAAYKDLNLNYEKLRGFVQQNIEKVIILGHSIMGVDSNYYSDVLMPALRNKMWIIYVYSDTDILSAEKFIYFHKLKNHQIKRWDEIETTTL